MSQDKSTPNVNEDTQAPVQPVPPAGTVPPKPKLTSAEPEPQASSYPISQRFKDDTSRAKRAQEQRKAAPPINVHGHAEVELKALINHYAEPYGGQDAENGYHFMCGNRKLTDRYPDQGYEPEYDRGVHVNNNGDPMYKMPTWMYKQNLEIDRKRSDALLLKRLKSGKKQALEGNLLTEGAEITVHQA